MILKQEHSRVDRFADDKVFLRKKWSSFAGERFDIFYSNKLFFNKEVDFAFACRWLLPS